jgi:hypothetical protein
LQRANGGKAIGRGRGIPPAPLLGERREALAVTVCLSRRPGKSWRRLDEDAERGRTALESIVLATVFVIGSITDTLPLTVPVFAT